VTASARGFCGVACYLRDFITAQGIADAFRDSEQCAAALDQAFSGGRAFEAAMEDYRAKRDRQVMALYQFTCQFASLQPPPPEQQQLMAAVHGNPDAMDGFARIISGVVSPAEFFSEQSVGGILAAAAR
jgi:2-polyprenyl-6-methoxyphenol hydroxylase-like FAD-dependent oxidoreductase